MSSGFFNYSVDGDTMKNLLDLMERHRPKDMPRRVSVAGDPYPLPSRDQDHRRAEPLSKEKLRRMVQLSHEGLEQKEIAERLGVTQSAVSKRLCQMGHRRNRFKNRALRKAA